MAYKRILTIQDISCLGQCSMTVALPILSACGHETCILPVAMLSTHTGGFGEVYKRDLTEDMPAICEHWKREGITFDCIYVGYLSSAKQIEHVLQIIDSLMAPGGVCIVDPAMADHGKLYAGIEEDHAAAMEWLCDRADILIPNLTEACLLTGTRWKESFEEDEIREIMDKLAQMGVKNVLLTGVETEPGKTGVALLHDGMFWQYSHDKSDKSFHGTGDIFASAFTGAYLRGKYMEDAARIAAEFTALSIWKTYHTPEHPYGVRFEAALPELMEKLGLG